MLIPKALVGMAILAAMALATPCAFAQGTAGGPGGVGMQDRDRPLPREENRVGTAAQLPPMPPDDDEIYGANVMSSQERAAYLQQLKNTPSEQKRVELRLAHHHQVQQLAAQRGAALGKAPSPSLVTAQERTRQEERAQIYGYSLMTPTEVNRYFEKLRAAASERQREQIRAEHRREMDARARERGAKRPD